MVQILNTRNEAQIHGVKALVYGPSGIGKTRLTLTMDKPIILSAESGLLSLRNHDYPVIKITDMGSLNAAYQWLTESPQAKQFNTIYVDSITEVAEKVLVNAKGLVKDPRMAYNTLLEQMIPIVKAFRDLPGKHVFMSAKEEAYKDEVGVMRYGPMMPGNKVGQQLPYLFDQVFRMGDVKGQDNKPVTVLQTKSDMYYEAKDRSGALAIYEMPDVRAIISKILTTQGAI